MPAHITLSTCRLQAHSDVISSITKFQTFFPFVVSKANKLGELNIISSGLKW